MLRTADKRLFLGQQLDDVFQGLGGRLVDGYIGWWDAAQASTITVTGSGVSLWEDLSASGFDLAQSTDASRPEYGARTINGVVCPSFDGSNDFLAGSLPRSDLTMSTFVVAVVDTLTAGRTLVGGSGNGGNQLRVAQTTGALETVKEGVTGIASQSNASVTSGTPFAAASILSASDCTQYLNSVSETDAHAQTLNVGLTMRLGLRGSGAEPMDGAIAEVIIYDTTLSTDDTLLVMQYLKSKWGTP